MNAHAKPTKNEIVNLEKSYWDAMKAKDGRRTSELSGKTALVTGAQGVMRIEKAKMGKMTEEGNWSLDSYALDDIEVSMPSPDVALIAYTVRQSVTMNGSHKICEQPTVLSGFAGQKDGSVTPTARRS
ncbi:nuclear transport factor 2 family protein [Phyllobacterium zundukense]|uniref:DUF4440 domain-containing protein n=1 Tax=Phyllobacterium zundukense TaxID=1867719 RepID=A0A2N9W4F5_9HYPH|nr:nuclear transport factor 2 family protein [Phyllobacterium zundukense]ATU91908.1 hypothetical protein BLM14_09940 [Phyllobacterium zundukense]PIO46623.1 hypothetical protein B5P45_02140 [Phyllobacterium zundukense]